MPKPASALLGLLLILSACGDRLAAHASLCKVYPQEHGRLALAAAHDMFRRHGWGYSEWHPTQEANVFHAKADAGGAWVQLNNDVDIDVINISVFSFLPDSAAAQRRVTELTALVRAWELPPAPASRSRFRRRAQPGSEAARCR